MRNLDSLFGSVLKVDLTTGEVSTKEESQDLHRSFLGGRGLNQFYLYQLLSPTTSPLDQESLLIFGAGLLSGTSVPGATRISIDAKNTFSNGVGSASAGEGFSPALKRAGYGTLIVTGKAKNPVYLWIENDVVRIEPAKDFWGRTTSEGLFSSRICKVSVQRTGPCQDSARYSSESLFRSLRKDSGFLIICRDWLPFCMTPEFYQSSSVPGEDRKSVV